MVDYSAMKFLLTLLLLSAQFVFIAGTNKTIIEIEAEFPMRYLANLHSKKTYRIDNSNGLTLTAQYEGRLKPANVVLSLWEELQTQLWEVDRIENGIVLMPRQNDFNKVTSFTEQRSDAYNVWRLGKLDHKIKKLSKKYDSMYLLRNFKSKCLAGFKEDEGIGRVEFKRCRPTSRHQYWRFYEVTGLTS